jgi:DNA polymerase-4
MDAFYASVEQRDNPELRGRPVAVGGSSLRGVVAAASYEARKFGVRSAMPSVSARKRCPELVFVKPRFEVYSRISRQIRSIFFDYTPLVQPLSLDEAYLDLTEAANVFGSATAIAREIKRRIEHETGLTASAGVSVNKFVAKAASAMNKPDGLTVVRPDQVDHFVALLPIENFFGVGKVTADKFHKLGVFNGSDLRRVSEAELVNHFGRSGVYFFRVSRGIDERPVQPDHRRKSVGAERTFFENISEHDELDRRIVDIADRVWERVERAEVYGRTVTVKIKYMDFEIRTRSRTFARVVETSDQLQAAATELLRTPDWPSRPVRLLGVCLSNLRLPTDAVPEQLRLGL